MRGVVVRAAVSALAVVVVACSSGASAPISAGEEPASTVRSPIINGQNDTTHEAVVAIIGQQGNEQGLCSGTIVKVDPATKVGWVLTAAHCVTIPPVMVLQGDDFSSPTTIRYEILDFAADSRYTGQTSSSYDFGMVRILGVDASTPTIPIATSPDGLANGAPVLSVGYGRTTLINSGSTNQNTLRHHVAKSLSQLSSTQIGYDMSDDGICQGDSGGPVLVQKAGQEAVVGVHSYVQGDCNGFGVSGRATASAAFVQQELALAPPPDDCSTCEKISGSGNSECAVLTRTCLADKDCSAAYQCIAQCGGTASCKASCFAKYPRAEGPFAAASSCTCTRTCASECGKGIACASLPKCGYKYPAGTCATCTEGACCDESFACTADSDCYACLKGGDADPKCAQNAKRKALATCVAAKCSTECAGTGLANGADAPAEDPAAPGDDPSKGSTTVTKSGCAVAAHGALGGHDHTGGSSTAVAGAFVALALAAGRRRARGRAPARG